MDSDAQKQAAALRALDFIEDGMALGLGTGSTAEYFVRGLADRVQHGLTVRCVPTSDRTEALARGHHLTIANLNDTPHLDLTVDGADELDSKLRLIKGGGGALLREKIVASASRRMIVIADASKKVEMLGRFPLPVEVVPFGARVTSEKLIAVAKQHGCVGEISRREDQYGEPFLTDGNNFIYDCAFGRIPDPDGLAIALNALPGVVDNGLFIGMASLAIVGGTEGAYLIEPK